MGSPGIGRGFVVRWLADTDTAITQRHQLAGTNQRIAPIVARADQNEYRVGSVSRQFAYPLGGRLAGALHERRHRLGSLSCGFHRTHAPDRE